MKRKNTKYIEDRINMRDINYIILNDIKNKFWDKYIPLIYTYIKDI